ncbi:MAG: ATP-binding cassette domain-containing protein [Thomasclavelia sp.]|nr:ATP-binding cassette domain-containing protein [Thomasclavelia sp.]
MSQYMIETKNLTKKFGAQVACNDLSIHVAKGEIYGFVGRNGAGKTTFLKMLSSLIYPTSGEILIDGKPISETFGNIGVLIEEPGIYPKLSAKRNIILKAISCGMKNPEEEAKRVLQIVGLGSVGNKHAGAFSLGMRQRLGLGMAMVNDPEILLLDEPINGLDPQGIIEIRNILLNLKKQGKTIILSSHILEELEKVADRFGIIESGKMVKELDNEGLYELSEKVIKIKTDDNSKAKSIIENLGYKNISESKGYLLVTQSKKIDTIEITKTLVNSNIGVVEIFEQAEDSEDVFVKMMGGVTYA